MKKLFPLACAVTLLFAPVSSAFAASAINFDGSKLTVDKTEAKADGIDNVNITVLLKDFSFQGVVGQKVTLASSRGSKDDIAVTNDSTDNFGKANFRVTSLTNGSSVFTAWVGTQSVPKTITVSFGGGMNFAISYGDLIKIPDDNNASTLSDTAVYYYAPNGKRYVFSNEKVYFTWYKDFAKVKTIPQDQMSLIPIGGNVTYRPGSKLVKFQTDIKTYLPAKNGQLRWVQTEAVAKGLFGADWNHRVDDISEAFYVNYRFGAPLTSALDAPLDVLLNGSPDIGADKGL